MTAKLYRLLPCSVCGTNYNATVDRAGIGYCCGKLMGVVPLKFAGEDLDQADTPTIVGAPPETTKAPTPEVRT